MNQEPTTTDILEAISEFSTSVDQQFKKVDQKFEKIEGDIKGIKSDIKGIKSDIVGIKSTMVTKDYLDDKLSDLRGDLTILIRKENKQVKALVDILVKRHVLHDDDRKQLFSMEPFPELSIWFISFLLLRSGGVFV